MGSARKPDQFREGHRTRQMRELALPSGAEIPPLPRRYEKPVRDAWRGFWRSPVSQAVDRGADLAALYRWAWCLNEFYRVAPVVEEARLVKGSTGQPSLNPLASYLATLQAAIKEAEREFGMTPMSRFRLGLIIGQSKLTAAALNKELDQGGGGGELAGLLAEFEKS